MKIGLIGCGNMARALARGWGRPLLCADPLVERARSLAAEVGGEALAEQRRGGRTRRPGGALPQARPAAGGGRRARAAGARRGLDPGRHPARRAARGLPRPAGLPLHALAARGGPPGCGRAGRRPGRRRRRTLRIDEAVGALFAELGTLVVLDDVARRRRDGADVVRARLRGARGRGAGGRRRALGHPGRAGGRAGRADARRDRRAAAPARLRHAGGAPRGLLAGRPHGARPGGARAGRRASRLQRRAVARCSGRTADGPRDRPHADRGLPLGADLRLHAADHPLHRHRTCSSAPACARPTRAPPTPSSGSCATSASPSCGSSGACCPPSGGSTSARSWRSSPCRSSTASLSQASSTAERPVRGLREWRGGPWRDGLAGWPWRCSRPISSASTLSSSRSFQATRRTCSPACSS